MTTRTEKWFEMGLNDQGARVVLLHAPAPPGEHWSKGAPLWIIQVWEGQGFMIAQHELVQEEMAYAFILGRLGLRPKPPEVLMTHRSYFLQEMKKLGAYVAYEDANGRLLN